MARRLLPSRLTLWFALVVTLGVTQRIFAQTSSSPAATPYTPHLTYDVVSIHLTNPAGPHNVGFDHAPHSTRFTGTNITMINLLEMAYGVPADRILNAPDWLTTDEYTVQVKSDAETETIYASLAADEAKLELQHMMQTVLAERFHIRAHAETRIVPQFELVIAKGGLKMRPSPPDTDADPAKPTPPNSSGYCRSDGCKMTTAHAQMKNLVGMLSGNLHSPVQDKTGLTGFYDYTLEYKGVLPNETADTDPNVAPPLTVAIQDQLGLKVQPTKGPVQVYVVDHIEKPSEN